MAWALETFDRSKDGEGVGHEWSLDMIKKGLKALEGVGKPKKGGVYRKRIQLQKWTQYCGLQVKGS